MKDVLRRGLAALAAGAWMIDYHVVPKRFPPGFDRVLSGRAIGAIYAAPALGLALALCTRETKE